MKIILRTCSDKGLFVGVLDDDGRMIREINFDGEFSYTGSLADCMKGLLFQIRSDAEREAEHISAAAKRGKGYESLADAMRYLVKEAKHTQEQMHLAEGHETPWRTLGRVKVPVSAREIIISVGHK